MDNKTQYFWVKWDKEPFLSGKVEYEKLSNKEKEILKLFLSMFFSDEAKVKCGSIRMTNVYGFKHMFERFKIPSLNIDGFYMSKYAFAYALELEKEFLVIKTNDDDLLVNINSNFVKQVNIVIKNLY
ncbi:hypothetical protein QJU93_07305 [Pasteurella skyensis]|uniref:Uncharacterized protein n=1 Tax=Phocoenobacter skyensis TaxID=97481 RepID=A0AAJ6P115_9PAST|nr:hypothetical protein [Pasteurella skyensis]MDP8173163.1 hypothetical protein [Pasteurella skyensis]MDP8176385.1 hypothetical protein [Pasteurella skyensis]MDP8178904.1 hypothetical protein [Pasteurella skyensis]MDP8199102.1 hypothetical protein [Pasteurella skyensis]